MYKFLSNARSWALDLHLSGTWCWLSLRLGRLRRMLSHETFLSSSSQSSYLSRSFCEFLISHILHSTWEREAKSQNRNLCSSNENMCHCGSHELVEIRPDSMNVWWWVESRRRLRTIYAMWWQSRRSNFSTKLRAIKEMCMDYVRLRRKSWNVREMSFDRIESFIRSSSRHNRATFVWFPSCVLPLTVLYARPPAEISCQIESICQG